MLNTVHHSEGLSVELPKIMPGMTQRNAQTDTPLRICAGPCGEPIPAARLRIKPTAKLCARCQELAGDVPRIKRFDEFAADGETVISTFFTEDAQIEREMSRQNVSVQYGARSDDSDRIFRHQVNNPVYHGLSEAFEEGETEERQPA